jgi:hypothetical protein
MPTLSLPLSSTYFQNETSVLPSESLRLLATQLVHDAQAKATNTQLPRLYFVFHSTEQYSAQDWSVVLGNKGCEGLGCDIEETSESDPEDPQCLND